MATLVGKVGMVMKGAWNSSVTYEVLDAVSYANGLYIAKQNVPANTAPTNTTYWQAATQNDISNFAVGIAINPSTSKTLTITSTANIVSFLLYGGGRGTSISNALFFASGYVTASRFAITNLTNQTGITIDSSDSNAMTFVVANTQTNPNAYADMYCLILTPGASASWS